MNLSSYSKMPCTKHMQSMSHSSLTLQMPRQKLRFARCASVLLPVLLLAMNFSSSAGMSLKHYESPSSTAANADKAEPLQASSAVLQGPLHSVMEAVYEIPFDGSPSLMRSSARWSNWLKLPKLVEATSALLQGPLDPVMDAAFEIPSSLMRSSARWPNWMSVPKWMLPRHGKQGAGNCSVCDTWLHPDIQPALETFVTRTGLSGKNFVNELSRLCQRNGSYTAQHYTGLWKDSPPTDQDIGVLSGITRWIQHQKDANKSLSWNFEQFSKPDAGKSTAKMVQQIMTQPTKILIPGKTRILDFGCGSGTDIVAIQKMLEVTKEDTLCYDIHKVNRPEVTAVVLDASSDAAYSNSLDKALSGNEASVHVAISMVTFHHIRLAQRQAAYRFLHDIMAPGGIFIMAEWDNSKNPNRQIHYDLEHYFTSMFFYTLAPTKAKELQLATEYLSVDNWIAEGGLGGLIYDANRSRMVAKNSSTRMTPQEVANIPGNANRDFKLVWTKK